MKLFKSFSAQKMFNLYDMHTIQLKPLLLLCLITLLNACTSLNSIKGSEKTLEKEYTYNNFNKINVSYSFDIKIVQSDEYKVVVQYNENLEGYLSVYLTGETLKIGMETGHTYQNTKLSAEIHLPELDYVRASGSSYVHIPQFDTEDLKLYTSGASTLNASLNILTDFIIHASGASTITLEGKTKSASLDFSGASQLSGEKMEVSEQLNIDASGASSISVKSDGEIYIDASGASNINYYGKGTIVKSKTSGASSIKKKTS